MSISLVPASVPRQNVTIEPMQPHMEVIDTQTRDVWLAQQPVTPSEFKACKPEPPYVKSGIGRSPMDFAYFRRSPGASEDGPLEAREIAGLTFVRVARPIDFRGFSGGDVPTRVLVAKHHVLGFAAGRRVPIARLPNGACYVMQTESLNGEVIPEPADWTLYHIELTAPWLCELPNPAEVYFFRNLRSFAGPLREDQLPPGFSAP